MQKFGRKIFTEKELEMEKLPPALPANKAALGTFIGILKIKMLEEVTNLP